MFEQLRKEFGALEYEIFEKDNSINIVNKFGKLKTKLVLCKNSIVSDNLVIQLTSFSKINEAINISLIESVARQNSYIILRYCDNSNEVSEYEAEVVLAYILKHLGKRHNSYISYKSEVIADTKTITITSHHKKDKNRLYRYSVDYYDIGFVILIEGCEMSEAAANLYFKNIDEAVKQFKKLFSKGLKDKVIETLWKD